MTGPSNSKPNFTLATVSLPVIAQDTNGRRKPSVFGFSPSNIAPSALASAALTRDTLSHDAQVRDARLWDANFRFTGARTSNVKITPATTSPAVRTRQESHRRDLLGQHQGLSGDIFAIEGSNMSAVLNHVARYLEPPRRSAASIFTILIDRSSYEAYPSSLLTTK